MISQHHKIIIWWCKLHCFSKRKFKQISVKHKLNFVTKAQACKRYKRNVIHKKEYHHASPLL